MISFYMQKRVNFYPDFSRRKLKDEYEKIQAKKGIRFVQAQNE